ncbi:MAG: PKD domain-containing protein [Bacteroidota bacterium]
MRNLILIIILAVTVLTGCTSFSPIDEPPRNDYKVHAYYVVPADKSFSEDNVIRVGRAFIEIQRWYQTATGGITFEMLDEESVIDVYFADHSSSYYEEDWWNLLLYEMKSNRLPVESPGTITIIWVEGIQQVTANAIAFGNELCNGECGAAILPIHTLIGQTWPIVDLGTSFHEIGHTFGLEHPVEYQDLPLSEEEQPILQSVMCQNGVREGSNNSEHGFLTTEKQILTSNPFLKENVNIYQDYWFTNIINYPETGPVPEPGILENKVNSTTYSFVSNIDDAVLYYWYFGDGTTSNEANPTHEYLSSGLFRVVLTVTSQEYMTSRAYKYVEID